MRQLQSDISSAQGLATDFSCHCNKPKPRRNRQAKSRLPATSPGLSARRSFYLHTTVLEHLFQPTAVAQINWDPSLGQLALHRLFVEKGVRVDCAYFFEEAVATRRNEIFLQGVTGVLLLSLYLCATACASGALACYGLPVSTMLSCSILKLVPAFLALHDLRGYIRMKGIGQGGYNGTRVGKASHPGPPVHTSPLHPAIGRASSLSFATGPTAHAAAAAAATAAPHAAHPRSKSRSATRRRHDREVDDTADGVRRLNFDESMPARQTNSNGPERLCCPVASCPCSDAACIPKWSEAVLSKHVDAHLSGQLAGRVPAQWLSDRGKIQCRVCGLGVSSRLEVHPTCRPAERRQRRPEQQASSDGATQLMPTLSSMCDGSARTLKYAG